MRTGICSYAFRYAIENSGFTPLALVEAAAVMGAQAVQICDNLPLVDMRGEDLDVLRACASELGIVLEVGISSLTAPALRVILPIAIRLGAPIVRALLESPNGSPDPDQLVAMLAEVSREIDDSAVTLALENHFQLAPAALAKIVRRLDHPKIGVCLDPLNSLRLMAGPGEVLSELADLAVTAHIKDVKITRDITGFDIRGCPLGQGLLDGRAMVETLKEKGKVACVHLEAWMDPAEDSEATLQMERDWNYQGVAALRELLE